uniref:Uncharacterized protein n=1 Tax=Picea sitchensis TaxID=3332 RepID=B8LM40_PICSI|nr:unknown [Picea sitchensis]
MVMAFHGGITMAIHSSAFHNSKVYGLHLPKISRFSKQRPRPRPRPEQGEPSVVRVLCRKRERNWDRDPYKVIDITPPPRNLGIRCLPSNMQCGESVTIEDKAYIVSAVTYRYELRKGKYEPSEKRLDLQSTGRYLLNNYLEMLLKES